MKRVSHAHLYFLALVLLSHPSFAQTQSPPAPAGATIPKPNPGVPLVNPQPQAPPASQANSGAQANDPSAAAANPPTPSVQNPPATTQVGSGTAVANPVPPPAAQANPPAPSAAPAQASTGQPAILKTALPVLPKDVKPEILTEASLSAVGIKPRFDETNVTIDSTDQLPAVCLDHLSMDAVYHALPPPSKNIDGDNDDSDSPYARVTHSGISNVSELNDKATEVGVRFTFQGDDSMQTLAKCISSQGDSPKVDPSSLSKFTKPNVLSDTDTPARMGYFTSNTGAPSFGKKPIMNHAYRKLYSSLFAPNCANCNQTIDDVQRIINDMKEQPLLDHKVLKAEAEIGLRLLEQPLRSAKSIRDLINVRQQIFAVHRMIESLSLDEDSQNELFRDVQEAFELLNTQIDTVAHNDPTHVAQYADFKADTGTMSWTLKGMDADFVEKQKSASHDFVKGGSMRIAFIKAFNPGDPEVYSYLRDVVTPAVNQATRKMNFACGTQTNQAGMVAPGMMPQTGAFGLAPAMGMPMQQQPFMLSPAQNQPMVAANGMQGPNSAACGQAKAYLSALNTQANPIAQGYLTAFGIPPMNATDSFGPNAKTGMQPPAGSYALDLAQGFPGTTLSPNQRYSLNTNYGLSSSVFQNASLYPPTVQSMYQNSQLYVPGSNSLYNNSNIYSNPSVGVPLIPTYAPQQNVGTNQTFNPTFSS